MQGVERVDRELLDAEALVGHLVPEGSMFAFLAAHRRDVFADGEFEDLFPSGRGRPSIPASVMASILVLQTLHDLSDRETAEAARCDLRWKVATGMALDHKGFDPSTLVYWRKRLAKSERPQRINEAVRRVVEETGIVRGRGKRAVDSTILADAVATQDTITQLIAAIRRVRRVVPGGAEAIAAVCTGHDYSGPGKPSIDWDEPGAKDTLVSALVNDANALVEAFAGVDLDEQAQAALALLALVAGQDVEPAEGSDGTDGRWRIARKVAPDRVISTVDTEARHTRKSPEARRDGYRAHVVAEPETGIITDEALTTVGCPAGHTRPISRTRVASFGALCRGCPLRERCTTSKTGRKIVLHQRDDLLRRARRDWAAQPELREKYRTFRPNVERVISQIASRGGRRIKLRYRGTEKNNAWLTRRTAGLNLRNLVGRGLTRTAGVWVLAAQTA
ncbi:MAG: transposase [Pseudonocardia sp.]|nr:MAG: transposase [Pseudonocardia sp.]